MTAADWSKRREQFDLALTFLASWWREGLIVGVLAFAVIGWHKHNADQQAIGALREQMRVADSVIALKVPLVKVYEGAIVHDTVATTRTITRARTLRDTVLQQIHDTTVVLRYVAVTDSMRQACSELTHDCAAFRENALAVMHAQDTKIKALETLKRPKPCGLSWTLGPSVARTSSGWTVAPFAATAGIGCRF